ncbi:AraC-like DNA-binding protein [Loktanella ponticola]|uniref:AraC-like DNA-binding protein n=1 Tax=Yoonia ponticola TaxID=1524255 RepID=A0A7W9BNR8_9RHOB|nr:AraC family transcriptional regulator [Yoonia ponticola]MBB5723752.1 AraC-like DNA-binding protein [Yoonia ponticola]
MNTQISLGVSDKGLPKAREFKPSDWGELSDWLNTLGAPMTVAPIDASQLSQCVVQATEVGRLVMTQTMYGAAARIDISGSCGSPTVATTNISGHSTPKMKGQIPVMNVPGQSYVFDLSKCDHHAEVSKDSTQVHLIFSPKLLDEIALAWFGEVPDRSTWKAKTSFGSSDASWYAGLQYVMRLIEERPSPLNARTVRHIEETLSVNLLENWAKQSGVDLNAEGHRIVPQVVRLAEDYITSHADEAPTLAQIAQAANASVRSLTMNFKKFRGSTLGQFLREQRLLAAKNALLAADQEQTVCQIARSLNYTHLGEFAKIYRERFGERPSETLKRSGAPKSFPQTH